MTLETSLSLAVLKETLAVCKLAPHDPIPDWAAAGWFFSITRTADELSIVCLESRVPADIPIAGGWRALRVDGQLDFALTGILAGLSSALADKGISLFAISTYDTDYLLVREDTLLDAISALREAGYWVNDEPSAHESTV